MTLKQLGYSHLIDRYKLAARPLPVVAQADSRVKGRDTRRQGNQDLLVFETKYQPEDNLVGHLQFALRYEGINLEVLGLLFEKAGAAEIDAWLDASPQSAYARRAGFLFEWLTGRQLEPSVTSKARFVPVLDIAQQFGVTDGERNTRFRVINNLPGTRDFCPLVRRTPYLAEMVARNLRERTRETLAHYDQDLLRRAAAFLYLKETQSSFAVERENPSATRAQRFADLLRQADTHRPLTEARLIELQHAVIDPRFHEFTWRHSQNWVGTDRGYRRQIDFIPPRPEDLPTLMRGLLETVGKGLDMDAVILAAAIAFGFVFIHPFMDGNGRIHRYLIHEVLASAGFTPRGIVLPVSAVILANLDEYGEILESFSRPMRDRTEWNPDAPNVPATGNDAIYYRYFDATPQAEFMYRTLARTVEEDLPTEIEFLLGFDRARGRLNDMYDWPGQTLDLFIRVVHQNGNKLSKAKRGSHFEWMTDDEINAAQAVVAAEFGAVAIMNPARTEPDSSDQWTHTA